MRYIYFFETIKDRNKKEKEVKEKGLRYRLETNKKPIKQIDGNGNEHEYPYEIIIFID